MSRADCRRDIVYGVFTLPVYQYKNLLKLGVPFGGHASTFPHPVWCKHLLSHPFPDNHDRAGLDVAVLQIAFQRDGGA